MEDWALSLDALQQAIGYSFREPKLLMTALTHSSFVKGDGANADHNERLEFLGRGAGAVCQRTSVSGIPGDGRGGR